MNAKIFVLISILGISFFNTACKKTEQKITYGIVTASKLAVRKDQNIKSDLIKYYEFGTPIKIIEKGEKITIGDTTDYWYREETTKGWLFGGYLIISNSTNKLSKFKNERIRCNVVCGGFSCFYEFEAYMVGDYYIATYFLNDYPVMTKLIEGIIIGQYQRTDDSIKFEKPLKIAGYDLDAKYVDNISSMEYDTKNFLQNNFNLLFYKNIDNEGEYYSLKKENDSNFRKVNREKCKNSKDEIWIDAHQIINKSISEIQNEFPLVKDRSKK